MSQAAKPQKSSNKLDRGTVIGLVIGVAGLLVGMIGIVVTWRYAEDQAKDAQKAKGELAVAIQDKISPTSTYKLDPASRFPHRGQTAKDIVSEAPENVSILVDFVAFEHYSSPSDFEAYRTALKTARDKGVEVKIIAYGPERARESVAEQFKNTQWEQRGNEQNARSGYKDPETNDFRVYDQYIDYYTYTRPLIGIGKECGPAPQSFQSFKRMLMCTQNHFCQIFQTEGIKLKTIPASLGKQPLSFWLIPNKKILFAFSDFGFPGPAGFKRPAFVTEQPDFVQIFTQQFDWLWGIAGSGQSSACYGALF